MKIYIGPLFNTIGIQGQDTSVGSLTSLSQIEWSLFPWCEGLSTS